MIMMPPCLMSTVPGCSPFASTMRSRTNPVGGRRSSARRARWRRNSGCSGTVASTVSSGGSASSGPSHAGSRTRSRAARSPWANPGRHPVLETPDPLAAREAERARSSPSRRPCSVGCRRPRGPAVTNSASGVQRGARRVGPALERERVVLVGADRLLLPGGAAEREPGPRHRWLPVLGRSRARAAGASRRRSRTRSRDRRRPGRRSRSRASRRRGGGRRPRSRPPRGRARARSRSSGRTACPGRSP